MFYDTTRATLSDKKMLYPIIGAAMIAVIIIGFGYMIGWTDYGVMGAI